MGYNKNFNGNGYRNNNYNRNNGGQYNNTYKNNGNHYRNDSRDNFRPQERTFAFDAMQYKKPDIDIRDMNGKIYTINGNFSTEFAAKIMHTFESLEKVKDQTNWIKDYPEIYNALKEWALELINRNIDGVEYTMKDVELGFGDIIVLQKLIEFIFEIVSIDPVKDDATALINNSERVAKGYNS